MRRLSRRIFCILLSGVLFVSCSTSQVWVYPHIERDGSSLAFVGFDVKDTMSREASEEISSQLSDGLSLYFLQSGFRVIERSRINFLMEEMEFQLSGLTEETTAIKLGELLNARYVVFGSGGYSMEGSSPFIDQLNLKMVHVETGSVELIATWSGAGVHLGGVIRQLGAEIHKELTN